MSLGDLTSGSVKKAAEEFDALGQKAFLKKHGFGKARDYVLRIGDRYYDSKAVAGAAHGYLSPSHIPMTREDFSGGDATVRQKLESLGFEVTGPKTPVGFETRPSNVLTNYDLVWRFGIGIMGGMRRNARRRHLVLISDPTKSLYDDRWEGDILHYTGMGKVGPQRLDRNQNATLAESNTNGETVHLFEVFEEGRYTYVGQVELADSPYQEEQYDDEGTLRPVWMFPLRLTTRAAKPEPTINQVQELRQRREKQARALSLSDLRDRASQSKANPSLRQAVTEQRQRSPFVAAYVKKAAEGRCDLCKEEAPFNTRKGEPYLECHHVTWLADNGKDTIDNAVALCPNCHRKMHSLNIANDQKRLSARIAERDGT